MIQCRIHNSKLDGNDDKEYIGNFYFNSLPRVGDILWLILKESNDSDLLNTNKQLHATVTYSAQWSSDSVEYNMGYLEVEIEESK